jgi:MraZ protein
MSEYRVRLLDEVRDFEGVNDYTLDTKGRLLVPAAYREALADGLCVVPGLDPCLDVWTREGYADRKRAAARLPVGSRDARRLRHLIMSVTTLEMDGQHRVTLPARLRAQLGLDREITVVGNLDHLEIWDRGVYANYMAEARASTAGFDTDFDL